MATCTIVEFKDVEIVYTDVSYSTIEDTMAIMDVNHDIIKGKPLNSVLSLVNVKQVSVNGPLLAKLRKNIKRNNPYILATAVIGLNPFTKVMLDTLIAFTGRKIIALDSYEEARLWLHHQKEKANVTQ
ncbi:MAG: hypothetical protein ABJH05_18520 [Fulvivirga sp.]